MGRAGAGGLTTDYTCGGPGSGARRYLGGVNRLGRESSLYLRQHQDNPVDWYPWGPEAFEKARREDLPVLLSVGYSTCHWCHVMAHESFEDHETAALQNRLFVSIKVDREERPDVDRVYMEALQAMTGSGGWPMTVFLLPDGRPYFAGTYFPPQDRHGLPAFRRVLGAAAAAFREHRAELEATAERILSAQRARVVPAGPTSLGPEMLAGARDSVLAAWDQRWGGLRGAPKFPQAPLLEYLITRAALVADVEAGTAAGLALSGMAEGGIRDQLGGGFHRYSVDDRWAVPHFEKMLYDQAQLISVYLHYGQLTGSPEAVGVARSTADFTLQQLRLPSGGFAAGLDADVGVHEGSTYLWSKRALDGLGGGQASWRKLFRLDPQARLEGGSVLQAACPWGSDPPDLAIGALRSRLLEERSHRAQPARDEKVVVCWNALLIAALAQLGLATGEERYLEAAIGAGQLLRDRARDPGGDLAHLLYGDSARLSANLEDRAAMGLAALWLHEVTGAERWLAWAVEVGEMADSRHRGDGGVWFDTPAGADSQLVSRPTTLEEGATRSGVSLMVQLCWRLHLLTGEAAWQDRAFVALGHMAGAMLRAPSAFGGLLAEAQVLAVGPVQLALIAPQGSHRGLLSVARSSFRPQLAVACSGGGDGGPQLTRGRVMLEGRPTAYVCRDFSCRLPTTRVEDMEEQLAG